MLTITLEEFITPCRNCGDPRHETIDCSSDTNPYECPSCHAGAYVHHIKDGVKVLSCVSASCSWSSE